MKESEREREEQVKEEHLTLMNCLRFPCFELVRLQERMNLRVKQLEKRKETGERGREERK